MTTDLLELVDKHLSAIAGVTVRDMPAVLWTGWTANLDATSGKSLGGRGRAGCCGDRTLGGLCLCLSSWEISTNASRSIGTMFAVLGKGAV